MKCLFLFFWTDFAELSFFSPSSPNSMPENPQDLCSPQLLQLLTPIFSPVTPPSSSTSDAELVRESLHFLHPIYAYFLICPDVAHQSQSASEEMMDTSKVEKFFTIWPENSQEKREKLKVCPIFITVITIIIDNISKDSFSSIISTCPFSGHWGDGFGDVGSVHIYGWWLPADLSRQFVRGRRQTFCPSAHALGCSGREQEKVARKNSGTSSRFKWLERKRVASQCSICPGGGARGQVISCGCQRHLKGLFLLGPITQMKMRRLICWLRTRDRKKKLPASKRSFLTTHITWWVKEGKIYLN